MNNWKDIKGFEGLYQVSESGEIRSLDRVETIANRWGTFGERLRKGKVISQQVCKGTSYFSVSLFNESGEKRMYVHRIVATAFITPTSIEQNQVNHLDGNKLNNHFTNLEWCTKSENMLHALDTGLSSARGGTHYKAVKLIDTNTGNIYGSIKQAARELNIANSYLKGMLNGRNKNITTLKRLVA